MRPETTPASSLPPRITAKPRPQKIPPPSGHSSKVIWPHEQKIVQAVRGSVVHRAVIVTTAETAAANVSLARIAGWTLIVNELHQASGQTNESVSLAKSPVAAGAFDTEPRPPRPRLFYLDHLRVLLTVLVVLHHAAITYANIPIWHYTEPARDSSGAALDLLVMFNQTFFMGFFFLIAGYFVPGSYDRKGGRAFMKDRLVRFGIPLLAFLLGKSPVIISS